MNALSRTKRQRRGVHARARQRGSLIVELVVVVPILMTLLTVAWWYYRMHTAQMAVYRETREPVFATATFACGNAGETSASYASSLAPQNGVGTSDDAPLAIPASGFAQVYRSVPGGPNNEVITRPLRRASGEATETVEGFRFIETQTMTFQAKASMMCNETVHDGKLDAMKRIAAPVFVP